MATQAVSARAQTLKLDLVASLRGMRALAWDADVLYASRGYTIYCAQMTVPKIEWQTIARYRPEWWRSLTCRASLSFRLVRDGFHALAILPAGNLIATVPGNIVTLAAGAREFEVSHSLVRGTRPLHIAATPDGRAFWGEYFDNPQRSEVHIYSSEDDGLTWQVAYTFAEGSIRHIHNVVFDPSGNCLWIFTGDYGRECRILRAALDFSVVDEVLAGNQQARAVAAVITEPGLYFASDTPLEQNYIYHLDRCGNVRNLADLSSSSIYGCRNRSGIFFSTMVEPSRVNCTTSVALVGSADGATWQTLADWRKDRWSMKFFQYGNAFLPDGNNATDLLAVSTIAVEKSDLQTSIWRIRA
jgi:hypothetical protein